MLPGFLWWKSNLRTVLKCKINVFLLAGRICIIWLGGLNSTQLRKFTIVSSEIQCHSTKTELGLRLAVHDFLKMQQMYIAANDKTPRSGRRSLVMKSVALLWSCGVFLTSKEWFLNTIRTVWHLYICSGWNWWTWTRRNIGCFLDARLLRFDFRQALLISKEKWSAGVHLPRFFQVFLFHFRFLHQQTCPGLPILWRDHTNQTQWHCESYVT